jgi:hypothetical protein
MAAGSGEFGPRYAVGLFSMTKTTVEMLDLYARVRAIEQAGQYETWEVDGGRRREYFDLQVELHRLLGRQIWEAHVFQRGHRPAASDVAEWESTRASRVELERALVDEKT